MREENKNVSKNGWKRVFGKKWFFPAVYLTMAALLLTGVLWYQNLENQIPEATDVPQTDVENQDVFGNDGDTSQADFQQDAETVMEPKEVVQMPVADASEAQIVTKFYDYDADSEDQEKALVLFNNKYYQSNGVDIASADGKTFDVTASLSGTVTEVKEDPLLGYVVKISHENDVSTYYASLEDVLVETGAEVQQGDTIGSAGRNIYGQASGIHVHFEVRKAGEPVNPEEYFNKPLSEIEEPDHREDNTDQSDGAEHQSSENASTEENSTDSSKETSSTSTEENGANTNDKEKDPSKDKEEDGEGETEGNNMSHSPESSAAMANA